MHEKITDKMDFIKIKNFCSSKDNIKKMRKEAIEKIIIPKDTSNKELLSKDTQRTIKFNNMKTNNQILKWVNDINKNIAKEDI